VVRHRWTPAARLGKLLPRERFKGGSHLRGRVNGRGPGTPVAQGLTEESADEDHRASYPHVLPHDRRLPGDVSRGHPRVCRAIRRFGIDHYAAVSVNPKEAEDLALARDVLAGIGEYLDHPRCVAIGEIGFNNITPHEEKVFRDQLELARARNMPVIIHLPHFDKPKGAYRIRAILSEMDFPREMTLIDHNTEETMPILRDFGTYLGLTVYPISKLTPERVSNIIRRFGAERVLVNGSADWGVSDPLSLVKVVERMRRDGHPEETIEKLVRETAHAFYSHSPRWQPNLDLEPVDPREFQR